ncbi:hypothetical protein [Moorena producens]|uniref:hypothetical protein n=1 Tax=Moorena producens TaxID=1155739 RepID=UPI000B16EA25|nr:hypothetical protein [Moorena producens]
MKRGIGIHRKLTESGSENIDNGQDAHSTNIDHGQDAHSTCTIKIIPHLYNTQHKNSPHLPISPSPHLPTPYSLLPTPYSLLLKAVF